MDAQPSRSDRADVPAADLAAIASSEVLHRTRSRLEPHREAIATLRRKRWTFAQIARWLREHGVNVTPSSVHRFWRKRSSVDPMEDPPASALPLSKTSVSRQPQPQKQKHRFNLDI
ncbi:MAG TPA: hypothetical protein DCM86_14155 [Verrucomicrobiales bacterium]|nr:hypothetical protein [Verrucomicrobiales bacterium]